MSLFFVFLQILCHVPLPRRVRGRGVTVMWLLQKIQGTAVGKQAHFNHINHLLEKKRPYESCPSFQRSSISQPTEWTDIWPSSPVQQWICRRLPVIGWREPLPPPCWPCLRPRDSGGPRVSSWSTGPQKSPAESQRTKGEVEGEKRKGKTFVWLFIISCPLM